MAEYFRDVQHQEVLLFIDNIFRFTQAGSEVSTLLGRMPSAVGYQPNLADEMGEMQERITSVRGQAITSMQAIYVPADDYTDPAPATTFAHLDATTNLDRKISDKGIFPAVDPLASSSNILSPQFVGAEHYASRPRSSGSCRSTPICRTSSRSSYGRVVRGGQGHGRAGAAHRALPVAEHVRGPSSSPVSTVRRFRSRKPSKRSRRSPRAISIRTRSRRSSCAVASKTWSATRRNSKRTPDPPGHHPRSAAGRRAWAPGRDRCHGNYYSGSHTAAKGAKHGNTTACRTSSCRGRGLVGGGGDGQCPDNRGELAFSPPAPLLGQLAEPGDVRLKIDEERTLAYTVSGGFLSVTEDGVTILAESCEPVESGTN